MTAPVAISRFRLINVCENDHRTASIEPLAICPRCGAAIDKAREERL